MMGMKDHFLSTHTYRYYRTILKSRMYSFLSGFNNDIDKKIQVKNLGFDSGKGKTRVLDGISFDLHGGESLAILATNGTLSSIFTSWLYHLSLVLCLLL